MIYYTLLLCLSVSSHLLLCSPGFPSINCLLNYACRHESLSSCLFCHPCYPRDQPLSTSHLLRIQSSPTQHLEPLLPQLLHPSFIPLSPTFLATTPRNTTKHYIMPPKGAGSSLKAWSEQETVSSDSQSKRLSHVSGVLTFDRNSQYITILYVIHQKPYHPLTPTTSSNSSAKSCSATAKSLHTATSRCPAVPPKPSTMYSPI